MTVKRTLLSRITAGLLGAALFVSACGDGTDDGFTPAQPDTTSTDSSSPSTSGSDSSAVESALEWPHDWTDELVGGGQFDAGDYEGQDLVLWFWAPW